MNTGKLAEMRAIFAGSPLELDTYPLYVPVSEDSSEYTENARLKARGLAEQLRKAGIRGAVLADDSGLEVEALGGRPGVLSARYGGADARWPDRRESILAELQAVANEPRTARFVCAMVLHLEDGFELQSFGVVVGSIGHAVRGRFGFGYDPIFIPEGESRTLAEFSQSEKNAISHRRRAADGLLRELAARRG